MQTIRLMYASIARPDLGYDELMQIRRTARVNNEQQGLSGLLCFGAGCFLQAIEGPRRVVTDLFGRIAHDSRHSSVELLSCAPIRTRSFTEWSMKLITWEDAYTARRRELLLQHAQLSTFTPSDMTAKQALAFLQALATLERRSADITSPQPMSPLAVPAASPPAAPVPVRR
jgi:Sensors of blue-light using FAD